MSSNAGDRVDKTGRGRGSAGGRLGMSRAGGLFEIDLRSLALFRIGVSVTLLVDLASRVRDMDAFYAARGVLPPGLARSLWDQRVTLSPFTWAAESTPLLWTGVLLLATAALCLALGLVPRWAAAAAWFLLAALQDRNPGLYMSGDRYLLLLLMWCVLLPTGARLSVRPAPIGVTRIRSFAGAGLLVQVMVVYVLTGLKKTGAEWFDGTALWYALNQQHVTAIGSWLRSQTALLGVLSRAIRWTEIFGPLLVLSPWRNGAARTIAVVLFWAFHLGIYTFQGIAVFQLVGLSAWLVFLPSAVWDRRAGRESRGARGGGEQRCHPSRWSEVVSLVPLSYLVLVMAYTGTGLVLRGTPHFPAPLVIDRLARFLHLQEGWAMFSSVGFYRMWFVAPGHLADGSEVNVLRRAPLDWGTPSDLQTAQRGFRWSRYLMNVVPRGLDEPPFRETYPPLLGYLCREWNAHNSGEHRLVGISIVGMVEMIPEAGSVTTGHAQRVTIATRDCPDSF
jgi:Vitamin K-dependent gamma-carboxylase